MKRRSDEKEYVASFIVTSQGKEYPVLTFDKAWRLTRSLPTPTYAHWKGFARAK